MFSQSSLAILACFFTVAMAHAAGNGSVAKKIPLVFIHGIKGSVLKDSADQVQWVSLTQALGLSTSNLALPLKWEQGTIQGVDNLKPGGILEKITFLPQVFEKQIYGKWLEKARKFNRPFYPFAYDWRRDNLETLEQFKSFLEKIYSETHTKIQVVAHSMGGLITLAALNQMPHVFQSVVFVGVPFTGGLSFLPDLTVGEPVGLNREILFPLQSDGLLVDENGREIAVDFFTPGDWAKNGWGLFANSESSHEQKLNFLTPALLKAKSFRKLLVAESVKYPPITVVYSEAFPTVVQGKCVTRKPIPKWEFNSLTKSKGDGRVPFKNAMPPSGVPFKTHLSQVEHGELLDDPAVIELVERL